MTADLHSHTHYSDGTFSPLELIELAAQRKINILAISDHDTMDGVAEGLEAGAKHGVRVIPAAEVTTEFHNQELHILAYFPEHSAWKTGGLQKKLREARSIREQRARKMVEKLKIAGLKIEAEDVLRIAGKGSVGRPHVARALLEAGQIRSFDHAFSRYLNRGRPAWVDKYRMPSEEAIGLIHASGGIAVLAHPGLLEGNQIPRELVDQGIDGIEVFHTRHDTRLANRFLQWTQKHHLLATGGSDCHGISHNSPTLGDTRLDGPLLEAFLRRMES